MATVLRLTTPSPFTIPNPLFGHHPLVGHFEYLAHFLFNHCQIKDTPSGTTSEHAPGIF